MRVYKREKKKKVANKKSYFNTCAVNQLYILMYVLFFLSKKNKVQLDARMNDTYQVILKLVFNNLFFFFFFFFRKKWRQKKKPSSFKIWLDKELLRKDK
jgi:amino acid transporter